MSEPASTLAAAAVLGTQRAGHVDLSSMPACVCAIGDASQGSAALLATASALRQYTRAGAVAEQSSAQVLDASEPDRQIDETGLLDVVLAEQSALLSEACALMASLGLVASPALLPKLLAHGRRHRDDRPSLGPVLGARGRWLASLNPEWSYALDGATSRVAPLPPDVWEYGDRGERLAYLTCLREQDAAAGRELLENAWDSEQPDDRVRLIAALETGLSMEDEPLLERGLRDSRKHVRETAAQLLACLPASGFSRRMAERVLSWVNISVGKRGKVSLDASPPDGVDAAMKRDGLSVAAVEGLSTVAVMGPNESLLSRAVSLAPLDIWTESSGQPCEKLVHAAAESDWSSGMLRGWALAAAREFQGEWAASLLGAMNQRQHMLLAHSGLLQALLRSLDEKALESHIAGLLKKSSLSSISEIIKAVPTPWGVRTSKRFVEAICAEVRDGKAGGWAYGSSARLLVASVAVHVHADAMPLLRKELEGFVKKEHASDVGSDAMRVIELRERMRKEWRHG